MSFSIFASISIVLAAIVLYIAVRVLAKFSWILGFLRGAFGLLLLAGAVLLVLAGVDLLSYKQLMVEKPILTISFVEKEPQHFESTVVFIEEGTEGVYELHGDQWQVDARVIRWLGMFRLFGAEPGYRLDRLSGRYYSLEDERRKTRTVHQLFESEYGLDMWQWVHENGRFLPIIDAVYGSATYLPMEDGAIFQVSLSANGLIAKPLNPTAVGAVNRWR